MITPEQMGALQDALGKIADPVAVFIVRDVCRRISEAGQITSTAEYQLKRAVWLKKSKKDIDALLKQEKPAEELASTFRKAYDTILMQTGAEALENDPGMQRILQSAIELADKDFRNITQTLGMIDPFGRELPLRDAYVSCTDYAFKKVMTGAQSYTQACWEASKNLLDTGVTVVGYQSGVHTSIDAAVRRSVFGGMGLMVEKVEQKIHDEIGATGWELSAHEACAADHEPYQGRQYTNLEYEALNGTAELPGILKRRIGTLNCKHVAFPIIIGVSKPVYTAEDLQKMADRNAKGVTYEGKHYTTYQATQMQRLLEREIRAARKKIAGLENLPLSKKLEETRARYRTLMDRYNDFSRAAGLDPQEERLLTYGFGPKQERAAQR